MDEALNDEGEIQLIVLGTHDIDVAVAMVTGYITGCDAYFLPSPTVGWTKIVPWGLGGEDGPSYLWETQYFTGYAPCVWFDFSEVWV